MAYITGLTRDKQVWTPEFVTSIDKEICIGCGRCFKACAKGILSFEEEVDDDTDTIKAFMKVLNPEKCIGCGACGRTCPKGCFSFEPVELP